MRAQEDAHYYVAFGRRDQGDEEFLATAKALAGELAGELKRLPDTPRTLRRALEIGCGPGRLLRPMSQYFGQIYGVDVSDSMIAIAQEKLHDVPNAFPMRSAAATIHKRHFDFVYSYAVFQHIPSAEVVFSYLRETIRVLRHSGVARLQLNGLPKSSRAYTTWEGVRIGADEIHAFTPRTRRRTPGAHRHRFAVHVDHLAQARQRRRHTASRPLPDPRTFQRLLKRASSSSNRAPRLRPLPPWKTCRKAAIPASLAAFIDDVPGRVCYVGPRERNGFSQVNVFLPEGARTGLLPLRLEWRGVRLAADKFVRVIRPGPSVPRLNALTDAINLMSATRIESGLVKASIEEVDAIETFSIPSMAQPSKA